MFGLGLGRLGLNGGRSLAAQIMAMSPKLWLEPSVSGGYQDSAGTTALYAPGGGSVDPPVGLALDKSQGLALGPELVTNGDFSSGTTGWSSSSPFSSSIAVVGGALRVESTAQYGRCVSPLACVVGKTYVVSGVCREIVSGDATFVGVSPLSSGGAPGPFIDFTNTSFADFTFIFTATVADHFFTVGTRNGGALGTIEIDNISVRELPGNHASQATSTARPVLSARKNLLLATATLATQNVTTVAGQYTIQFSGAGSVTASGTYVGALTSGQTFTASAGTLTLTVAGSVTSAQLEAGSTATGYQSITNASTYDASAAPLYWKFDGVDDVHNVTFPSSLGSACTVITANLYAAPTILTAQTIGTSLAINATHCGKLVFDRALTGPETAIVTAWANKQGGL